MRLSTAASLFAASILPFAAVPAASALAAASSRATPPSGRACDPGTVDIQTMVSGLDISGFKIVASKSTRFVAAKKSPKDAGAAQGCQGAMIWLRLDYVYDGVPAVAYASVRADADYTTATGTPAQVVFGATSGDFFTSVSNLQGRRTGRVAPLAIERERLVSTSVIISRSAPKNF